MKTANTTEAADRTPCVAIWHEGNIPFRSARIQRLITMLLGRYRISAILTFALVTTFLSATAFVVVKSNESLPASATISSFTTMNRDPHRNEDVEATNDDDLVDYGANNDDDAVQAECETKTVSIAFCGNSMLYFNDSPRLLELVITIFQSNTKVIQDSCLRGGATLSSLFEHGNGMATKFKTTPAKLQLQDILSSTSIVPNYIINPVCSGTDGIGNDDEAAPSIKAQPTLHRDKNHLSHFDIGAHTVEQLIQSRPKWDYIVLNDYTQGPARISSRKETQHVLRTKYVPLIQPHEDTTTVIVVQTPAYQKENIKDSKDLGDFIHFTNLLAEGTAAYAQTLQDAGIKNVHVAPVGEAYRYLHNTNKTLWRKLYSWDHFHPSPYGTYLQICVLYSIMFQECVPIDTYNDNYWLYSRYMQPIDEEPLPKPSMDEANELRRVACMVTGVNIENTMNDNIDDDDMDETETHQNDDIDRSSG